MAQPCPVSLAFDSQDARLLLDSLSKGADPNQKTESGVPALYLAIRNGWDEVVDILTNAGAVLDNALFVDISINLDDTIMATWLIQNGVLSHLPETKMPEFFFWAAANNLVCVIPAFLENGLDLDVRDSKGHTALHNAIISSLDATSMVETLLAAGANPNLKCGELKTHSSPLHLAALISISDISYDMTRLLLDAGADYTATDDIKNTPLQLAIESKNNATVQLLISTGANINSVAGWMDRTPLMIAIISENKEVFDILIEANCDIHILDRDNSSAVGHAVFAHSAHASPYMLWSLLMLGGDPNSGAGNWKYPLHTDLNYGGGKFSRMLIFFGADVNAEGVQAGSALAISGRVPCSLETTKMLLDAGADVNGGCRDALSWIVGHGTTDSDEHAQLLLEAGADVYGDRKGLSILEEAIFMRRSELIQILFKYGARADMVEYAPTNPLGYIRKGGYTSLPDLRTLEVMLKHGAKINNKDVIGMETTPLHAAAREASLPHVRLLLEAGADPNDTCLGYSMTPLHYAAGSGSPSMTESWRFDHKKQASSVTEIGELLLENNGDPLAIDKLGRLPLHYAAGSGKTAAVKMLLQSGGSESARVADGSGTTPLHLAVSPEIVTALVESGALVSARDRLGRSPLQTATRRGEEDVVGELLLYCSDEEIRIWRTSIRGNDGILWYVFARLRAWIIDSFYGVGIHTGTRGETGYSATLKVPERRQKDDILALSPEVEPEAPDENVEISLRTIRVVLLVLLISIIIWRLL
jgi:ankyrin repeat protein